MMARQARWPDLAFIVAAIVALAVILWLGNGLTFFLDEWRHIDTADDWTIEDLMRPHNQHWILTTRLIWNSLMATVGLDTYLPYQLLAALTHVTVATAIYVYGRRQTYPVIALAAAVVFLFFGSGAVNLFMGVQYGFNLAAATGAWALVILMREPAPRHAAVAAALLVVTVATNGVGLPFVVAAGTVIVVSRVRWHLWWTVVPATLAFGAWYLIYGASETGSLPTPDALIEFATNGIAATIGDVTGLSAPVGLVLAVVLGVAVILDLIGKDPPRLGLVGGAAGLVSLWIIVGVARADATPDAFAAGRFVHIGAVFALIAFLGWFGRRELGVRRDPVRVLIGVAIVAGIALVWNLGSLWQAGQRWQVRADEHRAALAVTLAIGGSGAIPADRGWTYRSDLRLVPTTPGGRVFLPGNDGLVQLIERYGDPLDDPLAARGTDFPDSTFDAAFADALHDAILPQRDVPTAQLVPVRVIGSSDVRVETDGCTLVSTAGTDPWVEIATAAGATIVATPDTGGEARLQVSSLGTYLRPGVVLETTADAPLAIALPDIGADRELRIRVTPPPGTIALCSDR